MTAEEILKSKNITPNTKHHNYEYLYRSMVDVMNEYASQQRTEGIKEGFEAAREIDPLSTLEHGILYATVDDYLNEKK